MKLLDRYVIFAFLKNYLISFVVLVGLYIVLDMVFQFDEITRIQTVTGTSGVGGFVVTVRELSRYYFYQSFLFFAQLAGVIPGIAAGFTLLRMTRNNELTAILAAGVPLLSVARPVIFCAVLLSGLAAVDQEFLVPPLIPYLTRSHKDYGKENAYPIPAMQDSAGALLVSTKYRPPTPTKPIPTMEVVDVIRRDENLQPLSHTFADGATWNLAQLRWDLTNGYTVDGLRATDTPSAPRPEPFYQSNITPQEIDLFHSGDTVDLLSIREINQLLQRPQSYGTRDLLRVKHTRVAQWFMNVIMLLLSIPAVLTRDPGTLKQATVRSMVLSAAALAIMFIAGALAAQPPPGRHWVETWPALMAWMPIFIFGPFAVWLLDRIHAKAS